MELFDAMERRMSCRSYAGQPLDAAQLGAIREAIDGFDTLYPDVSLMHRLATETKGMFRVIAPHYLLISGQGKAGEAESAGFLYEQLALWLDAHEIGSVWLGKAKDSLQDPGHKHIVTLAFGPSGEPIHRSKDAFRRKPIEEVTNAPEDPCIQAAHLAPSGMNQQPWYWEKTGDEVLLYEQILRPPVSLLYKKTAVDMGIALCHYALACKRYDRPFSFERLHENDARKGYRLFGRLSGG